MSERASTAEQAVARGTGREWLAHRLGYGNQRIDGAVHYKILDAGAWRAPLDFDTAVRAARAMRGSAISQRAEFRAQKAEQLRAEEDEADDLAALKRMERRARERDDKMLSERLGAVLSLVRSREDLAQDMRLLGETDEVLAAAGEPVGLDAVKLGALVQSNLPSERTKSGLLLPFTGRAKGHRDSSEALVDRLLCAWAVLWLSSGARAPYQLRAFDFSRWTIDSPTPDEAALTALVLEFDEVDSALDKEGNERRTWATIRERWKSRLEKHGRPVVVHETKLFGLTQETPFHLDPRWRHARDGETPLRLS